nr:DEP domain-containing protein [Tanacetum cinerariifolium]
MLRLLIRGLEFNENRDGSACSNRKSDQIECRIIAQHMFHPNAFRLSNSENTIYALTSELKNQKGGQENANSINDSTAFEVEVRGREQVNSISNSSASPISLSISENLINHIKGEPDS